MTNTTKESIVKNVKAVNPEICKQLTSRGKITKQSCTDIGLLKSHIARQDMIRHLLNGDFIEIDTFDKVMNVSSAIFEITAKIDTTSYSHVQCQVATATHLYEAFKRFGVVVVNLAYVDDELDLSIHSDFDAVVNAYNAKQQAHFDTIAYHITFADDNIYTGYKPTAVYTFKHNDKYYIGRED